jgi:hypothetical protein
MSSLFILVFAYLVPHKLVAVIRIPCSSKLSQLYFLVNRVCRINNFFYLLQSESERIWILFASYSHVSAYSQIPFIRIICSYSLQNIRTNSHTSIQFDAKQIHFLILPNYLLANIRIQTNFHFVLLQIIMETFHNLNREIFFYTVCTEFNTASSTTSQIPLML